MGINEEDIGKMFFECKQQYLEIGNNFSTGCRYEKSIAPLLGFEYKVGKCGEIHRSSIPVNITNVRIIRVECIITGSAYINGTEGHGLFEFDIDVEPGFKLTKVPQNIIYMPIRAYGRQIIDNITLRILSDTGELIDFRGKKIIVKLELKVF